MSVGGIMSVVRGNRLAALCSTLKTIALWGFVALAGYVLFPMVSTYISGLQVVTIVAAINALATITLWREAERKPPRPKKEFLDKLMKSEPITPKHGPPKAAGGAYSTLASDDDRRFFADFADFADVVNWWLADEHVETCWRLQERHEGNLILNVDDSYPTLGRRYDIFHNQVRLGILEIRPQYGYSAATPQLFTEIALYQVRLLGFDSIAGFLHDIAMHVSEQSPRSDGHFDVNHAINTALTKALWQNQQISEFEDLDAQDWGELSLHLQGQIPERCPTKAAGRSLVPTAVKLGLD
jgi:hypothetical protein